MDVSTRCGEILIAASASAGKGERPIVQEIGSTLLSSSSSPSLSPNESRDIVRAARYLENFIQNEHGDYQKLT